MGIFKLSVNVRYYKGYSNNFIILWFVSNYSKQNTSGMYYGYELVTLPSMPPHCYITGTIMIATEEKKIMAKLTKFAGYVNP